MTTIFAIAYEKISKKLVIARVETYTTATDAVSAQTYLNNHCSVNNLNISDFIALEMPYDRNREFAIGKHIYDEATGELRVSPDWDEPIPTPKPDHTAAT